MRERAELLGGTLTISSTSGRGTQITADLPTPHSSSRRAPDREIRVSVRDLG